MVIADVTAKSARMVDLLLIGWKVFCPDNGDVCPVAPFDLLVVVVTEGILTSVISYNCTRFALQSSHNYCWVLI